MTAFLTPPEALLAQTKKTPNEPYLHQWLAKQWKTYTWAEVTEQSLRMASAIRNMGIEPGSVIGISGMNTVHWMMADFAISLAGCVSVGMYPKQTNDAVSYIIEHSEMKAMFLGPGPDVAQFLKLIPENVHKISFPYPAVPKQALHWDDLVEQNQPFTGFKPPKQEDLWSVIYTSGTTGNPKGVPIPYSNIHTPLAGLMREMPPRKSGEIFLSYLPLAHAFERCAVAASSLYLPAQVYLLDALERLADAIVQVRPTRFFGVPVVWTRIQSAILRKVPQEKLDKVLKIPGLSWYVKRKIRASAGFDRCDYIVSGAAALPKKTAEWFHSIGMPIYQGYGMTENLIYVSFNRPGRNRMGSVGIPFKDSLIRISPEGEIQNKHAGILKQYHKDPSKNAEIFTEDGWLKTGDKGHLDKDGYLYITGRTKDIFKTLRGKYIAPGPIESAFMTNHDIDHCCLIGSGMNQTMLLVNVSAEGRSKSREAVEASLRESMKQINATVEAHETVARVVMFVEPWTIDSGLLSPTLKVRRQEVEKQFASIIERVDSAPPAVFTWV